MSPSNVSSIGMSPIDITSIGMSPSNVTSIGMSPSSITSIGMSPRDVLTAYVAIVASGLDQTGIPVVIFRDFSLS